MFFRPSAVCRPSPDRLKRQSLITHMAYSLFGDVAQAIQFLNHENPSLGGRPLDVSMTSANGFSSVERAIRLLAEPHAGRKQ